MPVVRGLYDAHAIDPQIPHRQTMCERDCILENSWQTIEMNTLLVPGQYILRELDDWDCSPKVADCTILGCLSIALVQTDIVRALKNLKIKDSCRQLAETRDLAQLVLLKTL